VEGYTGTVSCTVHTLHQQIEAALSPPLHRVLFPLINNGVLEIKAGKTSFGPFGKDYYHLFLQNTKK
jgi:hypothetical protein